MSKKELEKQDEKNKMMQMMNVVLGDR